MARFQHKETLPSAAQISPEKIEKLSNLLPKLFAQIVPWLQGKGELPPEITRERAEARAVVAVALAVYGDDNLAIRTLKVNKRTYEDSLRTFLRHEGLEEIPLEICKEQLQIASVAKALDKARISLKKTPLTYSVLKKKGEEIPATTTVSDSKTEADPTGTVPFREFTFAEDLTPSPAPYLEPQPLVDPLHGTLPTVSNIVVPSEESPGEERRGHHTRSPHGNGNSSLGFEIDDFFPYQFVSPPSNGVLTDGIPDGVLDVDAIRTLSLEKPQIREEDAPSGDPERAITTDSLEAFSEAISPFSLTPRTVTALCEAFRGVELARDILEMPAGQQVESFPMRLNEFAYRLYAAAAFVTNASTQANFYRDVQSATGRTRAGVATGLGNFANKIDRCLQAGLRDLYHVITCVEELGHLPAAQRAVIQRYLDIPTYKIDELEARYHEAVGLPIKPVGRHVTGWTPPARVEYKITRPTSCASRSARRCDVPPTPSSPPPSPGTEVEIPATGNTTSTTEPSAVPQSALNPSQSVVPSLPPLSPEEQKVEVLVREAIALLTVTRDPHQVPGTEAPTLTLRQAACLALLAHCGDASQAKEQFGCDPKELVNEVLGIVRVRQITELPHIIAKSEVRKRIGTIALNMAFLAPLFKAQSHQGNGSGSPKNPPPPTPPPAAKTPVPTPPPPSVTPKESSDVRRQLARDRFLQILRHDFKTLSALRIWSDRYVEEETVTAATSVPRLIDAKRAFLTLLLTKNKGDISAVKSCMSDPEDKKAVDEYVAVTQKTIGIPLLADLFIEDTAWQAKYDKELASFTPTGILTLSDVEAIVLCAALCEVEGNHHHAAGKIGLSIDELHALIKKRTAEQDPPLTLEAYFDYAHSSAAWFRSLTLQSRQ